MTRRTLAGRFILTTEQHPHGTHLKIRSTKSSQMLVVVEEEIEPLAQAMLNLYREEKPPAPIVCTGDRDSVGATIKAAREAKGWTVDDLAYEAGLSPKTIHSIEAGDTDYPLNHIRRCMYALNLYLGWKVTAVPRWRVDSHVSATIPGVNTRTWTATAYRPTGYISESRLFGTWQEALDYANQKAKEATQ